jgi:hypothetical protein
MHLTHVCEDVYHEMLSEIYQSRRQELTGSGRTAYCYKISIEYWTRIKEMVKENQFADEEEEIWFFKSMKPKFTSLIEYYTLVYHAELFMPVTEEENVPAFWKKENDKVNNFYRQHAAFREYYKSGQTHLDRAYFLRSQCKDPKTAHNKLYDTDTDLVTSHGHLATSMLAYDMYATYILQQSKKVA